MKRFRSFAVFGGFFCLAFAGDQLTKWWAEASLSLFEQVHIIKGFFALFLVRNKGGAFGLFVNLQTPFKEIALVWVPCAVIIFFVLYFIFRARKNFLSSSAFGLIVGGAAGNLLDRFTLGYVIDFFDVYWRDYHWPTFNIADSAISAGIFLLLLEQVIIKDDASDAD